MDIKLIPLTEDDREQFILDNQEAFNYGALEEFGCRDDHFEDDENIISRKTIEDSIDAGEAYRIVQDGEKVGGVILKVEGDEVIWRYCLSLPKFTAKVSDMQHGAKWRRCILK